MSERTWSTHGVGPYLITDNAGTVLRFTGLEIETPYRASTGYVLARDAWGRAYATEVAIAIIRSAKHALGPVGGDDQRSGRGTDEFWY